MLSIEQIKERMKDRKAAVVAQRVGITRAYLGMILRGERTPSYEILKRLSDYLEGAK